MSQIQLYDLKKRGTIIVGSPRSGSHYLQNVIEILLRRQQVPCVIQDQLNGRDIHQDINTGNGKYHICIANDLISKEKLIQQTKHLEEWHVIRLTRSDIISWAISCYFMFQKNSFANPVIAHPEFLHSGTQQSVYQEHLDQCPIYPLHLLTMQMGNRLRTYNVPCDVCVDYADLATCFQHICPWRLNDYPEIILERDFKNGPRVREMLESHQLIEQSHQSF
jgi:uncharacterized protein YcsI (UPF0317 family)